MGTGYVYTKFIKSDPIIKKHNNRNNKGEICT